MFCYICIDIKIRIGVKACKGRHINVPPFTLKILRLFKYILAHSTDGADPAVGDLVPGGAGGDAVVGITHSGVILIAAGADILIH